MADEAINNAEATAPIEDAPMPEALREELETITNVDRAAVIMLLLGEQQAADIIRFLDPKEVQQLGAAMVGVADL